MHVHNLGSQYQLEGKKSVFLGTHTNQPIGSCDLPTHNLPLKFEFLRL